MNNNNCIEQNGIIEEITDNRIRVRMKSFSACENCQTRSICNLIDSRDNSLEVTGRSEDYSIGDEVNIRIRKSLGYKALLLGYILPFILILLFLILFSCLGIKETLTGVISLTVLVIYYLILYRFRERIRKTFIFTVNKPGVL
jgi:sigma-E factor negative regulatory protein RseC